MGGPFEPMNSAGRSFPTVLTDTTGLPHAVGFRGVDLLWIVVVYGAVLVGAAAAAVVGFRSQGATSVIAILGLAVALGCGYRLWLARSPWLRLYPDRLEKRVVGRWRTLGRSEIEGVRAAASDRRGASFEVVPNVPGVGGILLRESLRNDDPVVRRWFDGARDLTAEAAAADKSAVLSDPRYGATEAERAKRVSNARLQAQVFNVACAALAVWVYFHQTPYGVTLFAVAAPIALAALAVSASNGLVTWVSPTRARPAVGGAFIPAATIAFAGLSFNLFSGGPLIEAAALVGLAAAVFVVLRATSARRWSFGLMAFLAVGFCVYGLAAFVNAGLDHSPAKQFAVTVQDKNVTGSRTPTYNLYVSPWDDQAAGPVTVASSFYHATAIGSVACMVRHAGALGVGWFEMKRCPPGTAAPPPAPADHDPT
ncbi:hypothetical protein [Phenylobacterium sp.]|jgi:hypothetical protein|uniref:hypothetical protein n=1 Tax=Phenylobacterium sp. TaxID=1871053 RepID=UPI002F429120